MRPSLSIIMPAFNEAKNIEAAIENTLKAIKNTGLEDYEIIIITNNRRDGTNDGTPRIADNISKIKSYMRSIHNERYVGLGFKYRQGVRTATKDYVMMIPGDNETLESSIESILGYLGQADAIISYTANSVVRPLKRRFVSRCFTILCNILFGLNLKYYNGLCIHKRKLLNAIPMQSDNFAYMAEILVYLLKSGVSYREVPIEIRPTTASASFKFRSVIEALGTLMRLFWEIHFLRRRIHLKEL